MLAQPTPQPAGRTRKFRFGLEHRPERQAPLAAGTMIGDRFRVIGLIGEGGMGRVYSAEHVFLRRKVALKLLRPEARGDGENVARFQQEALASSSIGHPNIVEIVDFAALPDGQVYMAMELLEGESLEDWLDRPGGALLELLEPLAQVADALQAAHEQGVFHRDIKPANVFLLAPDAKARNPGLLAKLVDFGIAKITSRETGGFRTDAGTVLGTPYYLAPERCAGKGEDGRADLYSLGVILYEALTGRLPFDASTFMGILVHHMKTAPLDPRQAAPERAIPDDLAQLCNEMLAKDPNDRPQTAADVAARLRDSLEHDRAALAGFHCGPAESLAGGGDATQRLGDGPDATRRLDPVQPAAGPMMSFARAPVEVEAEAEAAHEPDRELEEHEPARRSWVFVLVIFMVLGVVVALIFIELSGGLGGASNGESDGAPQAPPSSAGADEPGVMRAPSVDEANEGNEALDRASDETGGSEAGEDSADSENAGAVAQPPGDGETDGGNEGKGGETSAKSDTGGSSGSAKKKKKKKKTKKPEGTGGDSEPKSELAPPSTTGPTIKDDIYDE